MYFSMKNIIPMLPKQRKEKILELLKEDGSAKVNDLSNIFKVTEVTIRQDLEKLERDGLIVREHGGAHLKNMEDQVRNFSLAHQENLKKKEVIAQRCLDFIKPGDTIILDSDSPKIDKSAFASLGALSLVDFIITDQDIKEKHKQLFEENQIELIIAKENINKRNNNIHDFEISR